jgi:hypothetical protein
VGKSHESEIDAIIARAQERLGYLAHLKDAIDRGDDEKLKLYASKVCGIPIPARYKIQLPDNSPLAAIIRVAEERIEYVAHLSEALGSGDIEELKLYARKLCGMSTQRLKENNAPKRKK